MRFNFWLPCWSNFMRYSWSTSLDHHAQQILKVLSWLTLSWVQSYFSELGMESKVPVFDRPQMNHSSRRRKKIENNKREKTSFPPRLTFDILISDNNTKNNTEPSTYIDCVCDLLEAHSMDCCGMWIICRDTNTYNTEK